MIKYKGKCVIAIGLLVAGTIGCGIKDKFIELNVGDNFSYTGKTISYVMPVAGEAELMVEREEKEEPSKGTIRIATIGSPYIEILKEAQRLLEKKGYYLEIEICENYDQPNEKVLSGEVLGNFFQHSSYLERYNLEKNTKLKEAGIIYFQPMAIYPGQKSDIKVKEQNMKILVPEGPTGFARALFLLQQEGFLSLMEDTDLMAVEGDIKENPYGLTLIKMQEEEIWSKREEADYIISNTAYALAEGYHPQNTALATENQESLAAKALGQGLVVSEGDEEKIEPLLEVLCSGEMESFIKADYKGSLEFVGLKFEEEIKEEVRKEDLENTETEEMREGD